MPCWWRRRRYAVQRLILLIAVSNIQDEISESYMTGHISIPRVIACARFHNSVSSVPSMRPVSIGYLLQWPALRKQT